MSTSLLLKFYALPLSTILTSTFLSKERAISSIVESDVSTLALSILAIVERDFLPSLQSLSDLNPFAFSTQT